MAAEDMIGERFTGVVKKLIPGSNPGEPMRGFIDCADTKAAYQRDVFIHDRICAVVQVGQVVTFSVAMNKRGMPQAVDVFDEHGNELAPPSDGAARPPVSNHYQSASNQVYVQPQMQALPPPQMQALPPPTGQRAYELLAAEFAPAVRDGYGGAVAAALISAADLLGCGAELQRQLSARGGHGGGGGRGAAAGGGRGAAPGRMQILPVPSRPAPNVSVQPRFSPYPVQPQLQPVQTAAATGGPGDGQRYIGTVKSKQQPGKNGPAFGFIECADTRAVYDRDVFMHSEQAEGVEVGAQVSFGVRLNKKGHPQAIDLSYA